MPLAVARQPNSKVAQISTAARRSDRPQRLTATRCLPALDTRLRAANADDMKFWLAAALAMWFVAAAPPPADAGQYLVRLQDSGFPSRLRDQGIKPLYHSGQLWAVQAEDEKALRQSTEDAVPATSVMIELQPGSEELALAIAAAGGIVTRTYNHVLALSAILPTARIGEIQKLRGVKRLHKIRAYEALRMPRE